MKIKDLKEARQLRRLQAPGDIKRFIRKVFKGPEYYIDIVRNRTHSWRIDIQTEKDDKVYNLISFKYEDGDLSMDYFGRQNPEYFINLNIEQPSFTYELRTTLLKIRKDWSKHLDQIKKEHVLFNKRYAASAYNYILTLSTRYSQPNFGYNILCNDPEKKNGQSDVAKS